MHTEVLTWKPAKEPEGQGDSAPTSEQSDLGLVARHTEAA